MLIPQELQKQVFYWQSFFSFHLQLQHMPSVFHVFRLKTDGMEAMAHIQ
jgi:hypothetical protein